MVNTQGMLVSNQPLNNINVRVNSSIGKTSSTGEASFERKVSKTPKPGGVQYIRPEGGNTEGTTHSQFTSDSSTGEQNS